VTLRLRAPASTANLGPGFDCAAAALDLWNELALEQGDGEVDREHLGVQAFARVARPEGWSFSFTDRIPRERGLGSSASIVALGLVAAAIVSGLDSSVDELLGAGVELEGHADNLAASLAGGVTLTSAGRVTRLADDAPAEPIALVPSTQVNTKESRAALPESVPHGDAAYTAARAAYLGAALVSHSPELFAQALDDRIHEPYRAANAPLLREVRAELPEGAVGATISGSGPTVMVWARTEHAVQVAAELTRRYPDVEVLRLKISPTGAGPV
jgi:homoserine kinase